MKKIVVLLFVLLASSNIWAFNPPSYVGRNIHEVLEELDGVQIYFVDELKVETYLILLDDTRRIHLKVKTEIIITVYYHRIIYALDGKVNHALQNRIYTNLVYLHREELPNPIDQHDDDETGKSTHWRGTELGTYFLNPAITGYLISCDFLNTYGIVEDWYSHNYD